MQNIVILAGNIGQIGQMMSNRVSTGADAADIVELAHLLGS